MGHGVGWLIGPCKGAMGCFSISYSPGTDLFALKYMKIEYIGIQL